MLRSLTLTATAVVLALAQAWLGLTVAYYSDWPTSFWIATLSALTYLAARLFTARA